MLEDEEYKEKILQQKRESRKRYYETHKEQMLEASRKWREAHKKEFSQTVYKCRKRKSDELKAQGLKYTWLTEKERQKKLKDK